jgi:formylglycine-generating enzyme required for sulfatase activity
LDYSAPLSSKDVLPVPQIQVQPMSREQVKDFLDNYLPDSAESVWSELDGTPQFDIFRTPYFLKLLVEQVTATGTVPNGRAALFTGFVRRSIRRETQTDNRLFMPNSLLTDDDHISITQDIYPSTLALPDDGILIPKLCEFAHKMQSDVDASDSGQVLVNRKTARKLLASDRDRDILKAGVSLAVLDEDSVRNIKFFHQLIQEFFAARQLAQHPNPELVRVEWRIDKVSPTIEEELARIADNEPLPPLPATGWEETTVLAAAMTDDPDKFVRDLMDANLPLAARCATAPDVTVSDALKNEIRGALLARSQDFDSADLRHRIEVGLRLGELGDPRFERKTGAHGDYLLPPLVTIPAGTYPIGDDDSDYAQERPAHTVTLDAFEVGAFPVTNAEYRLFVDAGGYEDEQWWDTDEAIQWLRGEGSTEGQKAGIRDVREQLRGISEEQIQLITTLTSEQQEQYIWLKNLSDSELENTLDEWFPAGEIYRQPEYWDDERFNSPAQPVVGVCWYEVRAYCKWLSAQTGDRFDLPTEVQFEAAARGTDGREDPYGSPFDSTRSNTFESHIRRTTPVGIFDNATPEGAFDLTGNAYTWTLSLYDQENYPYPYRADDGREALANSPSARRVFRGGAWVFNHNSARSAYRSLNSPIGRFNLNGFLVLRVRPPSL